jgi:hypothetical protein
MKPTRNFLTNAEFFLRAWIGSVTRSSPFPRLNPQDCESHLTEQNSYNEETKIDENVFGETATSGETEIQRVKSETRIAPAKANQLQLLQNEYVPSLRIPETDIGKDYTRILHNHFASDGMAPTGSGKPTMYSVASTYRP